MNASHGSMLNTSTENAPDPDQVASAAELPCLDGQTILVADDDPIITQTLQMVLTGMGAKEVLLASDGVEARMQLAEAGGRIDGLVLDLRMPHEDGVAFLRQARALAYKGAVLLLSGEEPEVIKGAERLARLYGLKCAGALRKPANPIEIGALLARDADVVPRPVTRTDSGRRARLETVLYQPRIDMLTEQCVGAEALSRFCDQHGRSISPETAIAVAENDGSIDALTWQIIDQVLADVLQIDDAVPTPMQFSINASAENISKVGFVDALCERIESTGLKPSDFTIELTETRLVTDAMASLENLTRLRIKDIGVALDDFGTGHANVEQLGAYPFTELKVDRQFVMGAQTDRFAASCVEAAVQLARSTGLKTVAEGVETQWAYDFVRNLKFDYAQGFYFSKPIALDDFIAFARA